MKLHEIFLISPEDHDTALFEAGCVAAEEQYKASEAVLIKNNRAYWRWLRTQQEIVDLNFLKRLEKQDLTPGSERAFDTYYKMLQEHLKTVYFPGRLKSKLLEQEIS